MPVNKKQRKLEQYHQEITVKHMPGGWCYECHNPDDRDKLRMANGTLVDFEESHKISRTVPWHYPEGLEGGHPRTENGHVERAEAVQALRALPPAPRAEVQADQTRCLRRPVRLPSSEEGEEVNHEKKKDMQERSVGRRMFLKGAALGLGFGCPAARQG
ncbi:MAG: hypothetical protein MZU95_03845 [Desulfomicrobium escambiense]|nr:hypothetical protein [Desulfomicrobium escambiense]